MTEDINKQDLIKDLIKAKALMKQPKFDSAVKYGATNFKYASLGEVLGCIHEAINQCNLVFTQAIDTIGDKTYVVSMLYHVSGQSLETRFPIDLTGKMQDVGGRITYIKRYSAASIFGLFAEEDNDCAPAQASDDSLKELKSLINGDKEIVSKILNAKKIKSLDELNASDIETYANVLKDRAVTHAKVLNDRAKRAQESDQVLKERAKNV